MTILKKSVVLPVSPYADVRIQVASNTFILLPPSMKETLIAEWGSESEASKRHRGFFSHSFHSSPEEWEIVVGTRGGNSTILHEWGHAVWYVVKYHNLPHRALSRAQTLLEGFEKWWAHHGEVLGPYGATQLEEGWAEAVRHFFVYAQEKGLGDMGCLVGEQRDEEEGVYSDPWYDGMEIVSKALNWIVKGE
tara:strand:- start:128 stop:703 length:576 start_codon:yes stop_codon:yes gene_type:complete